MRRCTGLILVLALVSCDKSTNTGPVPTGAPATGAIATVAQEANALTSAGSLRDEQFERFLSGVDLRTLYPDRADVLIAQLQKTREAVIVAARTKSLASGSRLASVAAALGVFIVPEFAQMLADALDEFTKKSGAIDLPGKPYTSTESGTGVTTTTTMNISTSISSSGASVTMTKHWTFHATQVLDQSGATLNELTDDRTMVGAITVCPDAQGVSAASLNVSSQFTATAKGVTTRRTSTSGSNFTGQVNDAAALTTVSQTIQDKQSWEETAGDGSFDSVLSVTYAFKEGAVTLGDANPQSWSGSLNSSSNADGWAKLAAADLVLDAYAVTQPYQSAQKLWRNGRCVMVTAPDYKAETPIEVKEQDKSQHDERVDRGSQTKLQVGLKHRFSGTVAASVTAALTSGDKTLEPNKLDALPGSLTYKAPDEDAKKATAKLQSVSKRGIGTLVLDFHTGNESLTLSITGTVTGSQAGFGGASNDVSDRVTIGPLEFQKAADNVWLAMGTFTSQVRSQLGGPGGSIVCTGSETGPLQVIMRTETRDGQLVWVLDRRNSIAASGQGTVQCSSPNGTTTNPSDGSSGGLFLSSLGDLVVPADGGTIPVSGQSSGLFGGQYQVQGTATATTKK